jgi:aminoglycoside phosphotransferase (APT) family kinase protein
MMSVETPGAGSPDVIRDQKVVAWVETNIGGTVERCERQSRWRGGWWVDVRCGGELKKLYVREERKEDFPPWPIEHEAGVLQVLEKHGVPVPHVYGICDDPHAIIMEALPGHTSFSTAKDDAERLSVVNDFAEAVARMHSIDPRELVKLGVKMPETPEEISLGCFKLCEDMYLRGKKRPDPRLEFLRRWIYRNIPRHRTRVSILSVDSGQFLHEDGKVTGLFDFEYGCLGDPLIDLASIPGRAAMENLADIKPFFERYAELSGDELEPEVVIFHRVWWGLCTPLIVTPNLYEPPEGGTYFEYIAWYVSPLMGVLLALADLKGLELDRQYEVREARPSRWARIFDVMAARIPLPEPDEPYAITEQRKFAEFIKRMDAYRDTEAEYLKGVEQLIGRPVRDWEEADAELEKFVMSAGPEHDDALIHLFYRWALAQAVTLIDGINYMGYIHKPFPKFSELLA